LVLVRAKKESVIRKLFGKGYIETLLFIYEKGEVRFADIRRFCLENDVVQSRGTVSHIVRGLTDMKLIERKIITTRPIKTFYNISEQGKEIVEHLKATKQ
jgi:DNA-binding HxlR family transcriptional regulator